MSDWTLYAISGVAVVCVALYGLFGSVHVVRRIIAANLMASGVFLMLVALARRSSSTSTIADPVPAALVLTGIVVSVSATACALALAKRLDTTEAP